MISIIIPAYNESANLEPVISALVDHLERAGVNAYELILVNDGSTDETGAIARKCAGIFPKVVAIDHPVNRGIGAAIKSGLRVAQGTYVCVSSADGEIAPEDILDLYKMAQGADLVTSTRRRIGLQNRNFISGVHNLLIRILFGYTLAGREGIYVIRRSLLQDANIVSDTSLANLEILMQAARKSQCSRSGEITVRARLSGKSKVANIRSILRVMGEMVVLRIKKWGR